jgi:acyl-homoserine-lactone acylase
MRLSGAAVVVVLGLLGVAGLRAQTADAARWQSEAARVTIVRDDWGIAHVHGKSDADAVFGMIYAQCEDDFNRVEMNYLTALGRTAEAEGKSAIWQDLRQRLFVDPEELKKDYAASPAWLKKLMDAWADGINFYLATHKEVKPKVLTRFEPWMALSFTEGSIGGDIERVDLKKLQAFYGSKGDSENSANFPAASLDLRAAADPQELHEPSGSNGFAIAPGNTLDHHALLLINPHTSFFFRSELQMSSDEGLDAYGAVTWGQFFVYQGFNDKAGWMHTSSGVDAVDEFVETNISGNAEYKYGAAFQPYTQKTVTVRYKTDQGDMERTFTTYSDEHGPVTWKTVDGHWVTMKLMNIPIKALEQSYLRTKARSYAEYKKTMELKANSSNNTLFCGCGWGYRLLAWEFYSFAGYAVRLYEAGGWERSGERLEGIDDAGSGAASAESEERVRVQRQRLTLERRGRKFVEAGGLSGIRGARHRVGARAPCHARTGAQWQTEDGLYARGFAGGGVRLVPALVCTNAAWTDCGMGGAAGS